MLLIDLGNTNLKWGVFVDGKLMVGDTINYQQANLDDALDKNWGDLVKPSHIFLSSVASSNVNEKIQEWVRQKWLKSVEVLSSQAYLVNVTNGYNTPSRLGIDRLMALIAARSKISSLCCVIDCGTAITLDAVDATGKHLGGLIIPSLYLMQESLVQNTHQIDLSQTNKKINFFANNTNEAVFNGCLLAIINAINAFLQALSNQFSEKPEIIITGGDALMIKPYIEAQSIYFPHLVLEGILVYARYHHK